SQGRRHRVRPQRGEPMSRSRRRAGRVIRQLMLVAAVLCAWQFLPQVHSVRRAVHFMDPYFISSPSNISHEIWNLFTGANETDPVWSYLAATVEATLIGTGIGIVLGALIALWLSNSPRMSELLRPWLIALNAVPRVALIPI